MGKSPVPVPGYRITSAADGERWKVWSWDGFGWSQVCRPETTDGTGLFATREEAEAEVARLRGQFPIKGG